MPSIKGSVFALVVEDLQRLVESRKISRDELDHRLEPSDLEFLDRRVWPTEWCDIRAYARFMELLVEIEGGGSHEYLRRSGAARAARLLQAGLYSQFEYLTQTQLSKAMDADQRFQAFGRDLKRLTTLSASIYNFSRWEPKPAPESKDRYIIEITDASAFPEVFCWSTEGFINWMAAQHGTPDLWRWQRPCPELIVFQMTRSL